MFLIPLFIEIGIAIIRSDFRNGYLFENLQIKYNKKKYNLRDKRKKLFQSKVKIETKGVANDRTGEKAVSAVLEDKLKEKDEDAKKLKLEVHQKEKTERRQGMFKH